MKAYEWYLVILNNVVLRIHLSWEIKKDTIVVSDNIISWENVSWLNYLIILLTSC